MLALKCGNFKILGIFHKYKLLSVTVQYSLVLSDFPSEEDLIFKS